MPLLGADIEMDGVRPAVEQTLDIAIQDVASEIRNLGVASRFSAKTSRLFGTLDDRNTIVAALSELARSFSESDGQDDFQPAIALEGVFGVTRKLRFLSEGLDSLKDDAAREIRDALAKAN